MKQAKENTTKIVINAIMNIPVDKIFTFSDLELPYTFNERTVRSILARMVNEQKLTRVRLGHYKHTIGYEQYLFVYGSMKKGFQNHRRLQNAEYIGDFKTLRQYTMYADTSKMFPYVIENEKRFQIYGELYKIVFKKDFDEIDFMEGVPDFYRRKQINVIEVDGNRKFSAWIYFRSETNPRRLIRTNPIKVWGSIPSIAQRVKSVNKVFNSRRGYLSTPKKQELDIQKCQEVIHLANIKKGTIVSFKSFDEISFLQV